MSKHVSPVPGSPIQVPRWRTIPLRYCGLIPVAAACAWLLWERRHYWPGTTGYTLADTREYIAIAEALRHGYAHHALKLFPPGYPLAIAAVPWPVGLTSATAISALAFLGIIVATYVLALRLANPIGASIASATWLLWFARWPEPPTCPMSDSLFVFVMLSVLLAARPAMKGGLTGYAALVRPEGLVLGALMSLSQRRLRPMILCAAVAALVYLPYVIVLHGITGNWSLTGKAVRNLTVAPYYAGGCSPAERGKMGAAYPNWQAWPSPREPVVRAILGPLRRAYVRQMEPVGVRVRYNAGLWLCWIHGTWPLYALALVGVAVAAWKRRFTLVGLGLIPLSVSLTWLPWFMAGDRIMLPAAAGLAIWASGASLIAVPPVSCRSQRHIRCRP